jgi:anti-sigma factor RsiW
LRAWLVAHPEARQDWETEAQLSRALEELKDAPVSSNFTARVLQAAEREAARETFHELVWRLWRRSQGWVPKAALAVLVLGIGLFSYRHHEAVTRVEMAKSVAAIADVKTLPSPEILVDFDTIRRLGRTPPADKDLLVLLK